MLETDVRIYQIALRTFTPEGTLAAAEKLLPHVASLGFTHVQLTPVVLADDGEDRTFWSKRQMASGTENPMNNYRLKDYFHVDPEYGTDEDLKSFVDKAHQLDLNVLLDLVYFHCGPNNVFLKEHPDFVVRNEDGSAYCGEWHFPVLNYENPALREYLYENMLFFIREYDVDGYRCDVGDYIPLDFWKEGIRRCRELKPEIFMLDEGRKPEYLKVFDCNYFCDVSFSAQTVAAGEMSADAFAKGWQACRDTLPEGGRMLHFLDNHDVASDSGDQRLEKVLGHEAMEALHVLNYTLDGIPFVFCGNELADDLKHNMFSNRFHKPDPAVQWENAVCEVGTRRMEVVEELNDLRDEEEALCTTELEWLSHDKPEQVIAFVRPGERSVVSVINMRNEPMTVCLKGQGSKLRHVEEALSRGAFVSKAGADTEVQLLGYGYYVGVF